MTIGLGASGVSKAYFRMFSSSGVVFPAPPDGHTQHRKGKIQPQSGTVAVLRMAEKRKFSHLK
ncbi:hypothetical protein KH473_004927 [Escherichia coli]|nr:hypothetical protein [Escherichia coli]EHO0045532.1 hypothetical protein [Escherichia coli]